MKTARIGDYWRRLYGRPYKLTVEEIQFENLRGFEDGTVTFGGGITAICGGNGVGKSTLMSALFGVLNPRDALTDSVNQLRVKLSTITARVLREDEHLTTIIVDALPQSESDALDQINVHWIDSAYDSPHMTSVFAGMDNLEEYLVQFEPIELNNDDLEDLSYIVGKHYTSCQIYELDLDQDNYPYFRVESQGVRYGSETMGLGEISAIYIMWSLRRLPNDSILLVEEPETYLAVRSQEALMNVIARYSQTHGLWVILTTHAPAILRNVPEQHIRFLNRKPSGSCVITPSGQHYLRSLGLQPHKEGVILVEDRAAREFAKAWIAHYDYSLLSKYQIVDVGSDSEIEKILAIFPSTKPWFNVVGLFDADKQDMTKTYRWPYLVLPGTLAPEEELRKYIYGDSSILPHRLGRDVEDISMALSTSEGLDHHDWFEEIVKHLGVSYENLMQAMFAVWLSVESNELLAKDRFDILSGIIDPKLGDKTG